ncbi:PREDICTED: low-density lipoprotein receptor-related protein 2-like [Branchiostoma belcheri]|uniref:Low-density lipoprotein receptor-related protein 2-like n=1 Tax=Branchiostoma belcheri TaxID=7741 RepID=A0A6P4Z432_BRABE|nr:PREDICTED: low-density lipoprotein receptor-related protein 2-like [Branchiostoma belcheri]
MAPGLLLFVCLLSIGYAPAGIAGTDCLDPDDIKCEGSGECLPSWVLCNGYNDCPDGSDEEDCWRIECPFSDDFRCTGNGRCLSRFKQCDGNVDCPDRSDEGCRECPYPDDIKCESVRQCIRAPFACNGYVDCLDGSDEEDCWNKECYRPDDFRCKSNGLCVNRHFLCNTQRDCADGSDEEDCLSKECADPNDFKCVSNGVCMERWQQCNAERDCPDGSDEENCSSRECPNSENFRCERSGACVSIWWNCDGSVNCPDGSDEEDCWSKDCPNAEDFRCESNGLCVDQLLQCNAEIDCPDGSDEKDCRSKNCPNSFLKCDSGTCYPPEKQCDGNVDCPVDDTDERFCTPDDCPLPNIFCGLGFCINETRRCDGVADCPDRSDESDCMCTSMEFRCEDSGGCVKPSGVCDGVTDCDDGSDEMLCQTCAEKGLWQCESGECIQNATVCDGDKDCSSGADEENCPAPCHDLQLECDGGCLPRYRACDGVEDCSNGEDEIDCTAGGCGAGQFSCADGTCLSESRLCDDLTDCSGREDEDCGDDPPPGFPLGLASWYIPDVDVTGSSEYKPEFGPSQTRYTTTSGYCWVPRSVEDQWLQVYFGKTTDVTGVVISGGGWNWDLGSWVTSFTLAFSMDGASWAPYTGNSNDVQVFQGNRDRYNKVSRPLPAPVTSRFIRLYPAGYAGWVAMVMEVYVINDENTWLKQGEYVTLGVGLNPDDPAAVPKIPDLDMTASSRGDDFYPWQARLNNGKGQQQGACWSPDMTTDQSTQGPPEGFPGPGLGTGQWPQGPEGFPDSGQWPQGPSDGFPDMGTDQWPQGPVDGFPDMGTGQWPQGPVDGFPDMGTDQWPQGPVDGFPDMGTGQWPQGPVDGFPDMGTDQWPQGPDGFPAPDSGQWPQGPSDGFPGPDSGQSTDEWLQIKHDKFYEVAGVITQGAYNLDYWVTSYKLEFSLDGQTWTPYTHGTGDGQAMVFQGNSDSHRYARNLLDTPVHALYTRFYPLTFHKRVALRVEILVIDGSGCDVFCNGACRNKDSFCQAFRGCVPRIYQFAPDNILCEDILEAECGLDSPTELEVFGCPEIDSQFIPCGDDVSSEVFHESQACDAMEDCSTGKDEENCDVCAMECPTYIGDPCISHHWICDDLEDCTDGRDEEDCVEGVPKHCFFTCRDNVTCLPTRQLGDGQQDCAGGEDERPGDVEFALGLRWGSCSLSCSSVHGNASCVPDAFSCDDDVDCRGGEDEQDCSVIGRGLGDEETTDDCLTVTCDLPGYADPICVPPHQICDGYPDCVGAQDEVGCGKVDGASAPTAPSVGLQAPAAGQEATGEPTGGQEPLTAQPTSGQGSPDDQRAGAFQGENHGSKDQAMIWMVTAALGSQILYRLAF